MQAIRDHFAASDRKGLGPQPTDVELECIAQTWSEHCKHKIFNATVTYLEPGRAPETIRSLFATFIRGATETIDRAVRRRDGRSWLVSVFHDNAGVVAFDDICHLVYKVETHNSPSALDPYGGAMTGIVGVRSARDAGRSCSRTYGATASRRRSTRERFPPGCCIRGACETACTAG
jgi:phosphoribosylformylglycinamidine synthase